LSKKAKVLRENLEENGLAEARPCFIFVLNELAKNA